MDIFEKIDNYLNEEQDDIDEVDELLESFESLDESRKSQFVAKLIGLGVLVRDADGSLKPGKNSMSTEKVIQKLNRRGKVKKVKNKIKGLFS